MNLPSGTYTVQVQADGYPDTYTELEVWEEATVRDIYVMPGLAEGQTGILLTWEGEADLDLTLFTPWQFYPPAGNSAARGIPDISLYSADIFSAQDGVIGIGCCRQPEP